MNKSICGQLRACVAIVIWASAQQGFAQDAWETIGRDRDREVQIDRRTILQSDGSTKVAWGRIVLSPTEAEKEGYASIKALNRFDCFNRSFYTVKRVYLDASNMVLRDESVIDQRPILAARNSVDERMWREVCQPPGSGNLQDIAAEAGRVAAAASSAAASNAAAPAVPPTPSPVPTPAPTPVPRPPAEPARAPASPAPQSVPAMAPPAAAATAPAAATPVAVAVPAPAPTTPATPPPVATAPPRPVPSAAAQSVVTTPPVEARSRERSNVNLAASRAATQARVRAATAGFERAPAVSDAPWQFSGATGPEHWGRMRPEWSVCASGERQSPIDLVDGLDVELEPVGFDYGPTRFRVLDTGQALVVQVGEGLGASVRGQRYALVHMQFHHPVLERIDGERFDMSVQLHHRSAAGRVLIVMVPLLASGDASAAVQTIWNNLPLEQGAAFQSDAVLDVAAMLPRDPSHYLYMGSLSNPPCTENITWVVMRSPLRISGEQLRLFARMYPMSARPPQPLNDRRVLRSR